MHSRKSQKWLVYKNGQIDPSLQPLRIEESAGGKRMDNAELVVDPKFAKKMQDFSPLIEMGSGIEIVAEGGRLRHVGVVSQVIPIFGPQGETYKFVSQTQPYLFGIPAGGIVVFNPNFPPAPEWNPDGPPVQPKGQFKLIDDPIIFNPEIDGAVVGNMHSSMRYGSKQLPIFLQPGSVETAAGRKLHRGSAVSWTLSTAVYYLCGMMNGLQTYASNPTLAELGQVFKDSVDFVRNVKITDGDYLPECLDALLDPLGYSWRMHKVSRKSRKLEFFRRGTGGVLTWLNHQRFGEIFDPKKTNLMEHGVAFDSGRMANRIVGRGSKLQIEITAELCRAWPTKYDSEIDRDDLKLDALTDDVVKKDPQIVNAWRKWALNEGGDYVGLRPEITTEFPPQLKDKLLQANYLDWMVPRRRKFLPTLTVSPGTEEPIGSTAGIEVEWKSSDGVWKRVHGWRVQLLEHEAGIYINTPEIPEALFDAGDDAAIRVTATIETDFRITAVAEMEKGSPIVHPSTAMLDLDSMFHWREITKLSKYSGKQALIPGTTIKAKGLARDDREQLVAFVNELRDRWDNVDVAGAVSLEGVDQHSYFVGDRIAGVKGKNISFRSRADGNTYPQIAAITYDIDGQRTILHLQRVRESAVV